MKQRVSIICVIFAGAMILDTFNAGHALVMFFLLGVIPGTTHTVDAALMLQLYVGAAGFIAARIIVKAISAIPHATAPSTPVIGRQRRRSYAS